MTTITDEVAMPPAETEEPTLTIAEIAGLLKIKERTARGLVAKGLLDGHKVGSLIRVPVSSYRAYWRSIKIPAPAGGQS